MRRFATTAASLAALATVALLQTASAADMARVPVRPMPVAPAYTGWSGFYFGFNGGGAFAHGQSDFSVTGNPVFASAHNYLSGGLGGLQAGFNWQGGGGVVFGFETDFQVSGLKGSLNAACPNCLVPLSASYTQKVPWFGTARARLGFGTANWLMYVTGGYAYARLDAEAAATAGGLSATFSEHTNRGGWTLGGGVEVAFSPSWSAKLEYLHLDFGHRTANWTLLGVVPITDETGFSMNAVRAGINYRF